jgi:branched-chain amino acid transport system ATP-binding protein
MGAYQRSDRRAIPGDVERVYELFPRLAERRRQMAGTLSGGEQQMLAIGRALMSAPRLLMLDEPSLGLAPLLVDRIFEVVDELHRQGVTILLVEQNAYQALRVADRAYVLETGAIRVEGPASELADNAEIQAAYLGG